MKKSFRDQETGILTACGYIETNGADLSRDETDDFALDPGKWKLVGDEWVPYIDHNSEIIAQIASIESATGVPRVVREMMLTYAEDLALRTADQMTAAGTPATAEDLLAQNIGYLKTKAVDDQIRALRSQLK